MNFAPVSVESALQTRREHGRGPSWWPFGELWGAGESPRARRILALWLVVVAAALATGVANVRLGWNALELGIGGIPFDVTVYPPFVLAVLTAIWLGPTWGGVPIYVANLASALAAGIPWTMAMLFALAGTVETLMLWATLVALRVDADLREWRAVGWFLSAGLVAAVTGSLAAILWNASMSLDPAAGQRIWRGWVIGDFLQLSLVVAPLLRFAGPPVRRWIDRQFVAPPRHEFSYTHAVGLVVVAFAILGLVVFLGVAQALESIEYTLELRGASPELFLPRLREIVLVMALLSTALIVATGMFSTALARMGERQRREALLDSLTGCYNRRGFETTFAVEAERSRRLGLGIGLLFVDVDAFKSVNDRFGHETGDDVLAGVAARLRDSVRETDVTFRWGGEEFLVLLPHTTPEEVARVAERVRSAIAEEPLARAAGAQDVSVTASVGAASSSAWPHDADALVRAADDACYEAKRRGRDRVVIAD